MFSFLKCFCLFATIAMSAFIVFAPISGHCGESSEEVGVISLGGMKVLVIPDAQVTFEMGLIPEIDKYADAKSQFVNGRLPGVNRVYYFETAGRKVMMDSGWGTELPVKGVAREIMSKNGIKPEDITDILLTHMDVDHIGGLTRNGRPVYPNATLWVAKPELAAWQSGDIKARSQEAIELARKTAGAYDGRIRQFEHGEEILPGVQANEASGHTPGHTAYDITSGEDKLTVAGDLIHVSPVQFMHPDLSSVYDMDPQKAASSREKILSSAAADGRVFTGMHFPQTGRIKKSVNGGFEIR